MAAEQEADRSLDDGGGAADESNVDADVEEPLLTTTGKRARVLAADGDVMAHNTWDHAEWDPAQFAEAEAKVAAQRVLLHADAIVEFDNAAAAHWNRFYSQHESRFFKERNYLHVEFPDVRGPEGDGGAAGETRTLLEVGCGTGSSVFPLIKALPRLFVRAFDFSATAVGLVRSSTDYDPARCHAFVWDIAKNEVPQADLPLGSVDVALMIYVLSAIAPVDMPAVARRMFEALKPGGVICLRDYGRYDLAQMRFKEERKIGEHFYVRGDGTRVYFFERDELQRLFEGAGFRTLSVEYDRRVITNRKRKITMFRVWLQARFIKDDPAGVAAAGVATAAAAVAGAAAAEPS